MNKIRILLKNNRHNQLIAILLVLAIVLGARLFVLTVFEHGTYSSDADNLSTRSIYTIAPRGEIYDKYGRLLAGNKQSFTVRMSKNGQDSKQLNKSIKKLYKILNKNGDKCVDEFPIKIKNGKYYYTYDNEIKSWLKKKGFRTSMTAEEAFNAMRNKLGIDPTLDRYAAQSEMQTTYNQYPPISVSDMEYTADKEKKEFLSCYFDDTDKYAKMSAKEVFGEIRKDMDIDTALSDRQARKYMVIKNQIESLGYSQYKPAVIAKNVSKKTVMLIEENKSAINGVEVVSETKRYYPNKKYACHILGYLGKINESAAAEYEKKGYDSSELIGQEGIEGKYESTLKGINGEKKVQVNAYGEQKKVISKTSSKKGKDVYLTIDLKLQKTAQNALKEGIAAMRSGGSLQGEYGPTATSKAAPNAKTGAVVAIDCKTGDVLAMASYPGYDPNKFASGISEKAWESLQSENDRDPLSAAPLYNLATMSTVQPGSTFKPVTATAGLECGLNPAAYHNDAGAIKLGGTSYGCVLWNLTKGKSTHGAINMYRALEVSCNYYFYDVATGKDWSSGGSMGYKKKISIDMITNYAKQYGLGKATGIQLDEAVVPVPTKARKIAAQKSNLSNELYAAAEEYFTPEVANNSKKLAADIESITNLITEKPKYDNVHDNLLPKYGVKKSKCRKLAIKVVYNYAPQTKWNTGDAFNIAIGQGENEYTPLQMANYIATLGNRGVHHSVSVVKSVEDKGAVSRAADTKVKVSKKKYFNEIIDGMRLVAAGSESTVSKVFGKLDFDVAAKTGTAERSGKVNPKSEVKYIKNHLSQIDSNLSWKQVKKEMKRIMKKYPDIYTSQDTAVRRAVINLSHGKVTTKKLDAYKSSYDEFAWVVAMAPADDPQIAVACMIPQGMTAANAAPIVKEVLCKYFDLQKEYKKSKTKIKLQTVVD